MSSSNDDLMTTQDARQYLGVSKDQMSKFVKELEAADKVFRKRRDLRHKWLRRADVENLKRHLDEPQASSKELAPVA